MGIARSTVEWLRARGYDATHLLDEGLERLPDSEIVQKARSEGRCVLTVDLDFAQIVSLSGSGIPSVIIFRQPDKRPQVINEHLSTVIERFSDDLAAGAIVSVGEHRARLRRLPIP